MTSSCLRHLSISSFIHPQISLLKERSHRSCSNKCKQCNFTACDRWFAEMTGYQIQGFRQATNLNEVHSVTCRRVVGLHFGAEGCGSELVGGIVEASGNHKLAIQGSAHHISPGCRHAGNIHPGICVGVILLCQIEGLSIVCRVATCSQALQ